MPTRITKGKGLLGRIGGLDTLEARSAQHLAINTVTDTKQVRINSRSFTATSGDIIGFQSKPNATGDGTATVYGAQISPRFADAVGGASLVGLSAEPILKGTSGDLTGDLRAIQATLTDENAAGRTIAGIGVGLRIWHQLAHTFTGGVFGISMEAAGGGTGWSAAFYFDAETNLANKAGSASLPANTGYIRVKVDDTFLKIPLYADS